MPKAEPGAEQVRIEGYTRRDKNWRRWGPYLSDRAWGTVREDYSPNGTPWEYFPHEHARSRAYRWGENGLGGICDRHQYLSHRLTRIFLRGEDGRRPVYGGTAKFQVDPHWRDLICFHKYFQGDNGAGIGASHQTGWTVLVAKLMQQNGT